MTGETGSKVGAKGGRLCGVAMGAGVRWVAVAERVGAGTVEGKVTNWVGRSAVTTGVSSREAWMVVGRCRRQVVTWVGWGAEQQHRGAWRQWEGA